jgi:release factor glutamine methyltransferase
VSVKIHTIKDIHIWLTGQLGSLYPENEIKAMTSIIIKTLFNSSRLHYYEDEKLNITPEITSRLIEITNELKTNRPIQYVLGETSFYGCRISVSESVLIPRQETEELVDLIIKENRDFKGRITDIGTGSGCIAIALARNMTGASITGTDISGDAVRIAMHNARLNNSDVSFTISDIQNFHEGSIPRAAIVVSNPPYVRESEKKHMNRNILDFEPSGALFVPDNDPLLFYRHILESAPVLAEPGCKIYFEINEALGSELNSLMKDYGIVDISVIKDLNGKDRIAKGIYFGN